MLSIRPDHLTRFCLPGSAFEKVQCVLSFGTLFLIVLIEPGVRNRGQLQSKALHTAVIHRGTV